MVDFWRLIDSQSDTSINHRRDAAASIGTHETEPQAFCLSPGQERPWPPWVALHGCSTATFPDLGMITVLYLLDV